MVRPPAFTEGHRLVVSHHEPPIQCPASSLWRNWEVSAHLAAMRQRRLIGEIGVCFSDADSAFGRMVVVLPSL
jgi:hypothetical protein